MSANNAYYIIACTSGDGVTYPWGSVNGGSLFDQRVSDSHMTFLSHKMQRGQSILKDRENGQETMNNMSFETVFSRYIYFVGQSGTHTTFLKMIAIILKPCFWKWKAVFCESYFTPFWHRTLFPRFTLACLEMSRATMSGRPSCEARCRGVMPWRDSALGVAPFCSRQLATSIWFCLAAMCRGV